MSGGLRNWLGRLRNGSRLRVPGSWIIRIVALLVPACWRAEWCAEWRSELTHAWEDRRARGQSGEGVRLTLQMRALGSVRDALWLRMMTGGGGTMRADVRNALRLPRRHAGFAMVIALTLGLGIGAATSIFTVVDSLVLRALPFEDPDELVAIGTGSGAYAIPFVDPEAAAIWRSRDDVFADARAYRYQSVTITGQGEPRFTPSAQLEPGFLKMLGISPIVGRGFLPEESVPGQDRVVMLGETLWRTAYGADSSVPGRSVTIDGEAHTVVGVLPAALRMVPTGRVELATPLDTRTLAAQAGVSMIGRLRRDVDVGEAETRLRSLVRVLEAEQPGERGWSVRLTALDDTRIRGIRQGMTLLAAAVALLLLIACANAAGLMAVRNAGRRHEFAVRAALGGGRWALLRQLLCESAVLALLAGGLGVLLGYACLSGLLAIVPANVLEHSYMTVRMDGRVLAFAVLATTATGVLFGAAPAFQTARLSGALATAGRGTTASHTQRRFRSGLVVLELALAVVLLAAAGLLANSFARLMRVEPGMDADRLLVMDLHLPPERYASPEMIAAFQNRLERRLLAVPAVRSVSFSQGGLPPAPTFRRNVTLETQQGGGPRPLPILASARVDTAYFSTLGIDVEGRPSLTVDLQGESNPVVIDRDLAHLLWPGGRPFGKRFRVRSSEPWLTVVGVANDVKLSGPADRFGPHEVYHVSDRGTFDAYVTLAIRSAGDPAALTGAARRAVRAVDPELPVMHLRTGEELFDTVLRQPRFLLLLMTVFALLAITLAAIGIYGLVAYDVAQRTREIGVRLALGADRHRITIEVLRSGMPQVSIGIGLGVATALALSRTLAGFMFGITPTDPLTFVAVAATLVGVCILALLIPARRAARIRPTEALGIE